LLDVASVEGPSIEPCGTPLLAGHGTHDLISLFILYVPLSQAKISEQILEVEHNA